jgi:aryl-alcohol dehydrogenase-like predicted oxidoreductase
LNLPGYEWLRSWLDGEPHPHTIAKVRRVKAVADQLGVSLPKLAVAWCLKNPHVSTVILGASRISQLQENLAAIEVVPLLTDDVMAALDSAVAEQ